MFNIDIPNRDVHLHFSLETGRKGHEYVYAEW